MGELPGWLDRFPGSPRRPSADWRGIREWPPSDSVTDFTVRMIHTAERFVEKQAAFEAALATCRAIVFRCCARAHDQAGAGVEFRHKRR